MNKALNVLDDVRIAYPCAKNWEDMEGNEQVRFCQECKLNVYNFAALTRAEAEALIIETEGRLCGRIYRRVDGTVITRNCPMSIYLLKRKLAKWGAGLAAGLVMLIEILGLAGSGRGSYHLRDLQPFKTIYDRFALRGPVPFPPGQIAGRIARPTNISSPGCPVPPTHEPSTSQSPPDS